MFISAITNVLLERRLGLLSENPHPDGEKMIQSVQDFFDATGATQLMSPAFAKVLTRKEWTRQRNALDTMFKFCKWIKHNYLL